MALVDRSKFKHTSVATMEQADQKVNKDLGKQNNDRITQLKIEEGDNYFRLYPAHPDFEEATSIETKVVRFLPYMKQERDEKNVVKTGRDGKPIMVETVKPVWDARIHGGAPKDLVDEYEKIAKRIAEQTYEKEADRTTYLAPLLGNAMKGGKFKGIAPRQTWVALADKVSKDDNLTFGEFEFGKAVRQGINRIAGQEQSASDAMATDACFTDLDSGRKLKVKYTKAAQPNDKYICSIDTEKKKVKLEGGGWGEMLKAYPLSDEQIEQMLGVPPLIEYRTCFKRSDFDLQIAGLELFEAKHNYGILDSAEFGEIYAELDAYWPEETQAPSATETSEDEEAAGDVFAIMDKKELKEYAAVNNTGIIFKPTMSDEDMREALRTWEAANGDNPTADDEPDLSEDDANEEQTTEAAPAVTAATLRGQAGGLRTRFSRT